jgi:ribosomal protein S18 acetylase RimI-like enzyme
MCPALRSTRNATHNTTRNTSGGDAAVRTGLTPTGHIRLTPSTVPARAQPCPGDRTMAQVVVLDGLVVPAPEHWRSWGRSLAEAGYATMRTGALSPRQAHQAEAAGMRCVQELALLDLHRPATLPRPGHRTRRVRSEHLPAMAVVDRAAFGERWCLDEHMITDVRRATPSHRSRLVLLRAAATGPAGFLISGRAGRTGYIQRLAVHPSAQRSGVATALMADALRWMHRSRLERVFVNTHVENAAALELYRRHGFTVMPERLRVYESTTAL